MRLDGRRESGNVRDIRSKGKAASIGLGGLVIAGIITWLLGGNPLSVLEQNGGLESILGEGGYEYVPSAEEEELARFSKQILAGTEDTSGLQNSEGWDLNMSHLLWYFSATACNPPAEAPRHLQDHSIALVINQFTLTCLSSPP